MRDFFIFRRMAATVVVQILFWVGLVATIVAGIALITYGTAGLTETSLDVEGYVTFNEQGGWLDLTYGILLLVVGPLVVRIACEMLILFFRMNETLTDIRNHTKPVPAVVTGPAGYGSSYFNGEHVIETRPHPEEGFQLRDFFTFRRMVTTLVVQLLFWIGLVVTIVAGIALITYGVAGLSETSLDINGYVDISEDGGWLDVTYGILLLVAGPLVVRIACELLILFFRMNETLTDIRNNTRPVPAVVTGGPSALGPGGSTETQVAQLRTDVSRQLTKIQADMQEEMSDVREAMARQNGGARRNGNGNGNRTV